MPVEILRTKVTIPRRRRELLRRQRLVDLLDELLDYKLILLTAPAGYGKTSTLIDLAYKHDLPFCWFALDDLDQDLYRFIAYFVAAIDQGFPDFGESSNAIRQAATQGSFTPEQLARLCADEIYRQVREHFVLVVDDFHLIDSSPAVNEFLNRFIQDVDENCHLVISSRKLIALDELPLMVARSQVGGLGFQELSFRPEEIQTLMLQNYNQEVPRSTAEELAAETEGWITGLLLSAQTKWQGMADRLRTARVSGIGLYDYLLNQVLDQQPPEIRATLLRTAIFEEFDPVLCETVLGDPLPDKTWQETLDEIQQNNLFVLPIGESTTSLRYHHLFRDFLQNQFTLEQPDEHTRLLRALADVYAKRSDWERAYAIYQRLGDAESIANLLEEAGESMVKSGMVARMAEWLDALPLITLMSRPALLARRGFAAAALGETQRGLSLLDQAVATYRTSKDKQNLTRTLIWRAWVHYNQADYPTSLADIDEALELSRKGIIPSALHAEALRIKGLVLWSTGDLSNAVPSLTEALKHYNELEEAPSIARVSLALGATYLDMGEFGSALDCYNTACIYFREQNDAYSLPSALNDLAFLHHLRGDYQEAIAVYEEALAQAKKSNNIRAEMLILSGLGDLFVDLDAFQVAQEAYQDAREIAHRLLHHYMVLYLYLAEAAVERMKGEIARSRKLLEVAGSLTDNLNSEYTQALYQFEAGRLALAERDLPQAADSLTQAAHLFDSGGKRLDASRAHLSLAITAFESGDLNAAAVELGEAFRLVSELQGQHVLVPAARGAKPLLEAVETLPKIRVQTRRLSEQVDRFERNIPTLRSHLRRKRNNLSLTPPRLRIQALGKARVFCDKKQITRKDWQSPATRDLLFLILSDPKGWTKEEIGEILWPESSPAQLKLRFKNAIYRLRRALGQESIVFTGGLYAFNRDLDYEYDVERFWDAIERVDKIDDEPKESKLALKEAIQVYQGDYLPDAEGTWVMIERERIRQAYTDANMRLARLHFSADEYDQALSICLDLLAAYPSLEEAHRLVMRIHAAQDNLAAVMEQYNILKQTLGEKFGTSPSPRTQSLYNSLLQ